MNLLDGDFRASAKVLAIAAHFAIGALLLPLATLTVQAREGGPRTSPFDLYIDPFLQPGGVKGSLENQDCKVDADAKAEFTRLGSVTILDRTDAGRFLESAYAGKIGFSGRIASIDHVAVIEEGPNKFQVLLGSSEVASTIVYCGFGHPQYLDSEWAKAGFEHQTLYEQLPDFTERELAIRKLSTAYTGSDYPRVRSSLLARDFVPVAQRQKPVDRCDPGLEKICFNYKEADCAPSEGAGNNCAFEWTSADKQNFAVTAEVRQLADNENEIIVTGVADLHGFQDYSSVKDWTQAVEQKIRKEALSATTNKSGQVDLAFTALPDGSIAFLRRSGGSDDPEVATIAMQAVRRALPLPSPPDHRFHDLKIPVIFGNSGLAQEPSKQKDRP